MEKFLLTILYKIGVLTGYLDAVNFDYEYAVKLDSEGRITFLDIDKQSFYNLPPIIEVLRKLKRKNQYS